MTNPTSSSNAPLPVDDWSSWYQPTMSTQVWMKALVQGDTAQLTALAQTHPMNPGLYEELFKDLLKANVVDTQALTHLHAQYPHHEAWLTNWIKDNPRQALKGKTLETVMEWWKTLPISEQAKAQVADHCFQTVLGELMERSEENNVLWEFLARITPYYPTWPEHYQTVGLWAGIVVSFKHYGVEHAQHITQHWTDQMLEEGLRAALNQKDSTNVLWGTDSEDYMLRWKQWDEWLNHDPRRGRVMQHLDVVDQADQKLANDWELKWTKPREDGSVPIEDWANNPNSVIQDVLSHPLFGHAQHFIKPSMEDIDHLKTTMKEKNSPLSRLVLSAWVSKECKKRYQYGDREEAKRVLQEPFCRLIRFRPNILHAGLYYRATWNDVAMESQKGVACLLQSLNDKRVNQTSARLIQNNTNKNGENLLPQWLRRHRQAIDWRSDEGENLLESTWKRFQRLFEESTIIELTELAPQWFTHGKFGLLDKPLTNPETMSALKRKFLAQHAKPKSDTEYKPKF